MRIIPKTAKVKVEFFKNISVPDILLALSGLVILALLFLTSLNLLPKLIIIALVICVYVGLFIPLEGQRLYIVFARFVRYIFSVKEFNKDSDGATTNVETYVPFKSINGKYIEYKGYQASVLEVSPREFRLLSEFRQDQIIDKFFGRIIRSIAGKSRASIVKIDRKLKFDEYAKKEEAKIDELYKLFDAGELTQKELNARVSIVRDRIRTYNEMSGDKPIYKPFYYLVVYDENASAIDEIMENAVTTFEEAGMQSKVLEGRELAIFLKYNYTENFEEKDAYDLSEEELLNWCSPREIKFTTQSTIIDGEEYFIYTIRNYPLLVFNAWGYQIFNIAGTKVIMNLEPYEKQKAVKMIDRSLQELSSQAEESFTASSMLDKQTHIETLVHVLRMLQNDNETLFKVTLHIMVKNKENSKEGSKNLKKTIRRVLTEQGFDLSDNFCNQNKAMIASNVSRFDPLEDFQRAIQSDSVAAVFPFVLNSVMDDKGVILGVQNTYPVIVDFFARNNERVNSNMVIMGKSGSGKSYATKTLLGHLSAENSKIFILDPENEYLVLAKNLGGRLVDVGTATEGRINPFHIITTLDADEQGENQGESETKAVDNFAVHLQFLEEYFRVVLPGTEPGALDYLNNIIVEMYEEKGINRNTDFSKLEPKDYPIFDDLDRIITDKLAKATVEYDISNLRLLSNAVSKFSSKGRNSNLWNGESTLSVKENFCVFNFQSLLANKNNTIANAQMLLVLKWLDNEIIKNREFNIKHDTSRKIIVAIDEAHVFIDPKYPIALDFMYQLAKRIRKYNGMQLVITQNIKDFVGTAEIVRKSTAIINACQYSFIFALAPNDMDDLCTLYDKAGKINTTEQDQIINNDRGNAFIITSPNSRSSIAIIASQNMRKLFGEVK